MIQLYLMINTEGFFNHIFQNAKENSVVIMDTEGVILNINKGFSNAFGYKPKDITGKNFQILFTEKDQQVKKPERERSDAIATGSTADNNYLVKKNGDIVWVMGESVLVTNNENEKYIVKIIQDIHAQKQLENFLLESTEFLDTIFDSLTDTSLIILDSTLKVLKSNKMFRRMFDLKKSPVQGTRLNQLENPFWRSLEIKKELAGVLVNRQQMKDAFYTFKTVSGKEKKLSITSKVIEVGQEKRVLLVIKNA